MGILKHLLFWPVTGPLFLAEFSLGKVDGVVREELTDDSRIKAELMELQLKLELGDIDDEQYVAMEAELMQQLREIRQWREEFGMGVQGGPVRVQGQPRETLVPDEAADVVSDDDARAAAAEDQVHRAPGLADPRGGVDIETNFDWE
jgi:hypothetical protein